MIDGENQIRETNDYKFISTLLPRKIENTINLVPLLEEYSVSIDGDYSGYNTFLSNRDILRSSPHSIEFSGKVMTKHFDLNNKRLPHNLPEKGYVALQKQNEYHLDYGDCTFTCIHFHIWDTDEGC